MQIGQGSMSTYNITVTRDGKFWFIEIPALDGATQARRLKEVDEMAVDFIAGVTGEQPEEIHVTRKIELSDRVQALILSAERFRAAEAEARAAAAAASRAAAVELVESGMTVREVGEVLGVSHQRVQQLVH